MAANTIAVTGDVLTDYHLVKYGSVPKGYGAPMTETLQSEQLGGAWFLHDVLKLAVADLVTAGSCTLLGPRRDRLGRNAPVGHAYSVWGNVPRSAEDQRGVWRIADFLGATAAATLDAAKPVPLEDAEGAEAANSPTILVLDDIGLGFRANEHLWPQAIRSEMNSADHTLRNIVFKTNSLSNDNQLLSHLLRDFPDRLTLVLSVDDLRARGAAISKGLSWDRTIEELVAEFETGLSSCDIARAKRIIIHFDAGAGAMSLTRMPLKLGPQKSNSNPDTPVRDRACFERFLYLPDEVEGIWAAKRPGRMFGRASIITASVVRHIADPASYPLFLALGRGLGASRYNSEQAGGNAAGREPQLDRDGISSRLHWHQFSEREDAEDSNAKKTLAEWEELVKRESNWPKADPCDAYYSAFPHQVLTDASWRQQPTTHSNLLRDAVGPNIEYYAAVATDVVLRGPERGLLRSVPKARYGNFMTVDREEIERINALRSLIDTYRASPGDVRPLSIAVFGPPGSGKSFAIKQLAAEMFGKEKQTLEFNLSQFADDGVSELHAAFHHVRDASIKGAIPLVFWDEFDSDDLKWLKHFLAPMQDAEFRAGSGVHPFGKAIFVFAGGTCATFEDFDRSVAADPAVQSFFRSRKGPDFVSRLRGFVNIKGPNPSDQDNPAADPEYLIRRAMVLRSLLERSYRHLVDAKTKVACISTRVVRAFLRVNKFLHGARSLESVLRMSNLRDAARFDVAELTTPELLALHVTPDFVELANRPEVDTDIIEALSKAFHQGWRKMREQEGWTYAPERNDQKKEHPLLVDFEDLSKADQRKNYDPAVVTPAKLAQLGYRIRRRRATISQAPAIAPWTGDEMRKLLEIEHDIWVRNHMLQGFEYATDATDYGLRRHRDIAVFDEVPPEDQVLDAANIHEITITLHEYGYELVKE